MPGIDSSEIEFQCPSCGHELKQTVAGLKAERQHDLPGLWDRNQYRYG